MKYLIQTIKTLTFTLLLISTFTEQLFAIPSFPGAEGPGAETIGGRGGRIIEVTNLNGSGPGSLREACESSGPRIVVFKVAGIIDLAGERIEIKNPYITIAGQTAPEGGITLKGHELSVQTHDVVIRFLKIRIGSEYPLADGVGDALGMSDADVYNDIIDHCSLSWSNDENVQIWSSTTDKAPHDITFSWNIVSEGLEGHSTGFIAGSYTNTKDFKDVSLHHNLFANTSHRLPLIKIASAEVINNLIYNWGMYATGIKGGAHIDIIGNKYKPGPETRSSLFQEVIVEDSGYGDPDDPRSGAPGYASIYIKGNIGPNVSDESADNWGMVFSMDGEHTSERTPISRDIFERTTPLPAYKYPISIDSVGNAETAVLNDSGASRRINEDGEWVANRGTLDDRIINDYKNGIGFIPVSEDDVGGYPTIDAGIPYTDTDYDGMSDVWEDMHGFNKNNYNDNTQDKDGDGYTNIEEFINGTNPNGAEDETVLPVTEDPEIEEISSLLNFPYTLVDKEYIISIDLNEEKTSIQFTTSVPDSGITF